MKRYHLLLAALSIICLNSGCEDWLKYEVKSNVACNEGDTKCLGRNIYTCEADGNWGDNPTTECGEHGCSERTIQPASSPLNCYDCSDEERQCDGDKLKICVNRTWVEDECEYGCHADQCNECKPNEIKCEDGYIYTCTDGKWDETGKNKCEFGCINGLRADDGSVSCNECNENDMSCSDKVIKKCMGNSWRDIETCEFGCSKVDETEVNGYQCNECRDGDKKYYNNDAGACVEKNCTDHKYVDGTPLEVSCNKDFTGKGECLNGSAQCVDSGNGNGTFQFCLDGKWNSFGSCDSNNECSSLNGKTCADFNSVGYTCNDQKLKACPNNASCKSDGSGCASCTNDATKCEGKDMLECKNGEYQKTGCDTGKHCEATNGKAKCVTHECENGQQKCDGNDIYECQNYQWKLKSACTGNDKCIAEGNTANCGCTNGTAYCDGKTAKTCVNGKWQEMTCAVTCAVKGGKAVCVDCTAGQTKCSEDNKSIRSCTNGGSWAASVLCTDGMTCTGSDGNAKCVCSDGQAKCDDNSKNKISKCKDGKYDTSEKCDGNKQCEGVAGSAVCANNALDCTPGTKQCDGDKLKTCKPNGKWESQTCEKGCSNMACNECNEGEYGSGQENNHEIAINCVNHKWVKTDCYPNLSEKLEDLKKAICKGYCTVGGSVWCEGAGQARYRCTTQNPFPNDPAYEPEGAPFYALDGTCECDDPEYGTRCYNEDGKQDVLQICNTDGEWEDKQNCYICKDNICECQPGTTECDGNKLKTCGKDGKWEEREVYWCYKGIYVDKSEDVNIGDIFCDYADNPSLIVALKSTSPVNIHTIYENNHQYINSLQYTKLCNPCISGSLCVKQTSSTKFVSTMCKNGKYVYNGLCKDSKCETCED
ncbi:MAG: hypothetical protein IJ268_12355 [Proteobacteria bacterium]|nr:hypothetical protein [Pseudomonadota bacterium]